MIEIRSRKSLKRNTEPERRARRFCNLLKLKEVLGLEFLLCTCNNGGVERGVLEYWSDGVLDGELDLGIQELLKTEAWDGGKE